MVGDNGAEGMDVVHAAVEMEEIPTVTMIIKIAEAVVESPSVTLATIEVEVKIIHSEGEEDNGIIITLLIGTGITGTKIQMAKIIQDAVEGGMVIEAREIMTEAGQKMEPQSTILTDGLFTTSIP